MPSTNQRIDPHRPAVIRTGVTLLAVLGLTIVAMELTVLYGEVRNRTTALDSIFLHSIAYALITDIGVVLAAALALVVVWRATPTSANRVFAFAFAAASAAVGVDASFESVRRLAGLGLGALPEADKFRPFFMILHAALAAAAIAAGVRWSQLFAPLQSTTDESGTSHSSRAHGLQRITRSRNAAWLGLGFGGFALLVAVHQWQSTFLMVMILLSLTGFITTTLNLRATYGRSDSVGRSRMYWMVEAALLGAILLGTSVGIEALHHFGGSQHPIVLALHATLLPLSGVLFAALCAFAVTYHGAIDSSLVLRKTAVYAALCVLMTILFVTVENGLSALIAARVGAPNALGTIVAGSAVALGFTPVRMRLERLMDRVVVRLAPRDVPFILPEGVATVLVATLRNDARGDTNEADLTQQHPVHFQLLQAAARAIAARFGPCQVRVRPDGVMLEFERPNQMAADELQRSYHDAVLAVGLPLVRIELRFTTTATDTPAMEVDAPFPTTA